MTDSFNSDFYITAATVIPVMCLALTLQGTALDAVLRATKDAEPAEEAVTKYSSPHSLVYTGMTIMSCLFVIFMVVAAFAETYALVGLYRQYEIAKPFILIVMCILFFIFALAVVIKFVRMFPYYFYFLIGMPDTLEPPQRAKNRAAGKRGDSTGANGNVEDLPGRIASGHAPGLAQRWAPRRPGARCPPATYALRGAPRVSGPISCRAGN